MYTNCTFVRELNSMFDLVQKPNGRYEVVPKEDGWMCLLRGTLGGNVDQAWLYRWGEDTYLFVLDEQGETPSVDMYHFDFWDAMLDQVEERDAFDTFDL